MFPGLRMPKGDFLREAFMKNYEFWFIVGSQTLYGPEVLETVDARAREMAAYLTERLPYPLVYKGTAKSAEEISAVVREANYQEKCCGLVTWCHTFSPSKMWISGLEVLRKPYCHFVTQYNRDIPNDEINMDFMNLNQAAHGDREHGFAGARLRLPRKIIAGYWQTPTAAERLGRWMRTAIGVAVSRDMKVMRFGDNMRDVAVTEGDKIEAQLKFGWQVNTWAVGDLVAEMATVTEEEVKAQMTAYLEKYDLATENREAVAYQAREEIAIKRMLDREGCRAFADTFQDLYGLEQLPGLAAPAEALHAGLLIGDYDLSRLGGKLLNQDPGIFADGAGTAHQRILDLSGADQRPHPIGDDEGFLHLLEVDLLAIQKRRSAVPLLRLIQRNRRSVHAQLFVQAPIGAVRIQDQGPVADMLQRS